MAHDLQPLTPADLPALGRFLIEGFHAPAGAAFASPEVLRWKYFDPRGVDEGQGPRSLLAFAAGTDRIVGHVGVCPGRFRGPSIPAEGVSTLHLIDWLASDEGKGAGASLMRRAHPTAQTQYVLGASLAARRVLDRSGYGIVAKVPVYQKVLRVGYRWKAPGVGLLGRLLRVARDAAGAIVRPARRPRTRVELSPVETFGPEIEPTLASYRARAIFSSRDLGLLNHFLRYPRGGVSGWHVHSAGALHGFALLSVVTGAGGVRIGRIADCLLDVDDPEFWHSAYAGLTAELARQKADVAVGFASTGWSAGAYRASGFATAHALEFRLRDRATRLPRAFPFHLTPLEADYAYT